MFNISLNCWFLFQLFSCIKLGFYLDHGSLRDDLIKGVGASVDEAFQKLELGLLGNIATELRGEFSRHQDTLMSEISVIQAVKTQTDQTHTDISILKDIVEEVAEASNMSNRDTSRLLGEIKSCMSDAPRSSSSGQLGTITTKIEDFRRSSETKLSLVVALLTEAIKVFIIFSLL